MEVLELQPEQKKDAEQIKKDVPALKLIERRLSHELGYNEFYWNFMNSNVPIIIKNVSNNWECRKKWITAVKYDDDDGEPSDKSINFNYLREMTNEQVPVANCVSETDTNNHIKMPFHDFLDYWTTCITNVATEKNKNAEKTAEAPKNLYLKDWHLKASLPNYDFYCVPKQFASDWLNEYLVATSRDDYRFVYMGPKGSWTAFHCDVFGSYSWSTNIFGVKKWIMLPPGQELKLLQKNKFPFAIDEDLLQRKNVNFIILYQQENEALFVPTGWFHQVTNLTDTISVNHNFINACNLLKVWSNLSKNMQDVINEIEDCRQMENFKEHCQTMLRCSFGMNHYDFFEMLEFIAKRRLESVNNNGFLLFNKYKLNDFHTRWDLCRIRAVLECMINDTVVCDNCDELYTKCQNLLESMKTITANW